MSKSVSIIIPTYNRKHTVTKVIDSYLCQKYVKEIIFVIDGSTDGTYEYLEALITKRKSLPLIRIEKHAKKMGASEARNTGIYAATSEYILIGEDDVILKNDYVSTLLKCMDETGADIISGRILYSKGGETFKETINRCNAYKSNIINFWVMSVLHSVPITEHEKVPFCHALSLGNAKIFKKVLYSPDFQAREETDFYIRAIKEGAKLILCPHTMCFHMPQDNRRGGGWSVGILKFQYSAIKNNNMLVDRHYKFMKQWGMKGNKLTFKFLHLINRLRILYKYFRYSTRHHNNISNTSKTLSAK